MEIKQTKIEKSTAYLEATVSQVEIDELKEHAVDEMIKNVTVKGFRQGKAPKSIASQQIDPNKLTDHILSHVFNDIVTKTVKENNFRLLGRPVLSSIDPQKEGGWIIKLDLPLYPEIKLDDYKKFLKTPKSTKSSKTEEKKDESPEAKQDVKLEKIYDALLKNIKVEISPLLIEEEVNYSLERLTTQAKTLNLTLESYLKAVNKNLDEVKSEYSKKAEESIKLDIILLGIAALEKIDTPNEEVIKLAEVTGTPKEQLGQLKSVLNRRKTIDYLLKA